MKQKVVLVVEDNAILMMDAVAKIEDASYQALESASSSAAIQMLEDVWTFTFC